MGLRRAPRRPGRGGILPRVAALAVIVPAVQFVCRSFVSCSQGLRSRGRELNVGRLQAAEAAMPGAGIDALATIKEKAEEMKRRVAEKKAKKAAAAQMRVEMAAGDEFRPAEPPAPWRLAAHPSNPGEWYYFNEETQETSWDAPVLAPVASWEMVQHPTQAGEFYYHNTATGETSWDPPEGWDTSAEDAAASEEAEAGEAETEEKEAVVEVVAEAEAKAEEAEAKAEAEATQEPEAEEPEVVAEAVKEAVAVPEVVAEAKAGEAEAAAVEAALLMGEAVAAAAVAKMAVGEVAVAKEVAVERPAVVAKQYTFKYSIDEIVAEAGRAAVLFRPAAPAEAEAEAEAEAVVEQPAVVAKQYTFKYTTEEIVAEAGRAAVLFRPVAAVEEKKADTRVGFASRIFDSTPKAKEVAAPTKAPEDEVEDVKVDEEMLAAESKKAKESLDVAKDLAAKRRNMMKLRREVVEGKRARAASLKKDDLIMKNSRTVVSKKQSDAAKRRYSQTLKVWNDAVQEARANLGVVGFVPIGGASEAGQQLYQTVKILYTKAKEVGSE